MTRYRVVVYEETERETWLGGRLVRRRKVLDATVDQINMRKVNWAVNDPSEPTDSSTGGQPSGYQDKGFFKH